jgi:hypothetical protein|tara:strand:+ start:484 stop:630 length:147 start_codon:yes stop_codon:yes gene_type:complete
LNPLKQHKKLLKLATKAQKCLSRKEAQKLIIKADKAKAKLATLPLEHC